MSRGKPNNSELFRDRGLFDETPDESVSPERPEPVDPEDVDSALVRQVLLGAIGGLQARVLSGKFNSMDAQTLEKLVELVKDWPQLAKAVDELQTWGERKAAVETAKAAQRPATSQIVAAIREIKLAKSK